MQTIDLLVQNGKVLNVFTNSFEINDIFINNGKIIAVGNHPELKAREIIDANNQFVVPGFIDSHVHIESSLVTPSELGKVLVPMGVTSIVVDPHEIANVSGADGIKYMIEDAKQTPLEVLVMLPSSVPATSFEHNGATLTAKDLHPLYNEESVIGLAEVMDYPAVHNKDKDMMAKLKDALDHGYQIDGHGAGLSLEQLKEYRENGITTDHESVSLEQMNDRLAADMNVFLREGTVERDLQNTIQAVTAENSDRFSFCTDDKFITTIIREGSINFNIKLAIEYGLKPETAYKMASYNAAVAHKLDKLGAIKEDYQADLVIVDHLDQVDVKTVIKNGKVMTEESFNTNPIEFDENCVHQSLSVDDLKLPLNSNKCHVMGVIANHIETTHSIQEVPVEDGYFKTDLENDVLLMVDAERHHQLGTYGLALVHGFNIKNGAIATTVAHDSHNIVAVGTTKEAIYRAIQEVTATKGGIAVVDEEKTLATMPLPVAGLMSDKSWQEASHELEEIEAAFKEISDGVDFDPFITLSFLTLPVIPTLKLTDQGLYDFDQQKIISVGAE
ncbi:Adenine deaminase [Apilactobacillus kunkeei]|uniref:adenine deaminase n=1 Tax=Apilactobacillus kunkeei TaxID=148814 RepID=UPI0006CE974D|nr:adenine deaminase [Apilactobacillus kunkeei]KPN83605.1 Adenine deaminase [Apilactobacillus kunkeei]